MEVNHDSKKVYMEQMKILPAHMMSVMVALSPSPEQVASRFQAPIVTTYVDTEKIKFDRLDIFLKIIKLLILGGRRRC